LAFFFGWKEWKNIKFDFLFWLERMEEYNGWVSFLVGKNGRI
jgi:hypothetical protein